MITLWIVCLVPVVWFAIFRYRRRRMYKIASVIKGSKEDMPGIGIAYHLTGNTEEIMSSLQRFSYEAINNNGIMKGWLSHILYFVVVNPVDLEVVLRRCLEKDDLHRFIRKITGNGGIFAPVSIWRRRRKVMVPAFSPKILENFVEVFSEQSQVLVQRLETSANSKRFSIWPFLSSYTLDSVCETAMGVQIKAQSDRNSPFLLAINKVLNLICERIFHLWLQLDWMYKIFIHKYSEHQRCLKIMTDFIDGEKYANILKVKVPMTVVIQKKRETIKLEESKAGNNGFDLTSYQKKTFLDLLISFSGGESGYSNIELREEVLTLTVAGTDTSAVAIGYTLQLLAKYPKVQEKVYEELYEVFEDSNRPLVKEDLMRLSYLERVIKESLRLFPPVPFIIRKILEEIKLPSGVVLPAGSGVVVSIWGLHRDPNYWGPLAEHFDPDRFLPERFNLANTCSFMPFSSGPRNCVGYQYALMSIKTALSSILRKYKVIGEPEKGPAPTIRVKLDIMMKAVDGYEVALEKRK